MGGLSIPSRNTICTRLEEAIDRSLSKGYHGPERGPRAVGIVKLLQRDFASLRESTKQQEPKPKEGARLLKQAKKDKECKEMAEGKEKRKKESKEKEKKEAKEKKDKREN